MLNLVHPAPEPITTFSEGVLNVWRTITTIRRAGAEREWEEDSPHGRRSEYMSSLRQLVSLLGLPPWATLPSDAFDPEPPSWYTSAEARADYANAHNLSVLLEAAAEDVGAN